MLYFRYSMRSFTSYVWAVVGSAMALCLFIPLSQAQAATGQIRATILNEARSPVVNATVEVTCNGSTFATLGTTSATGTVVGDPTVGTTCTSGSGLSFRVSSSTFVTQRFPIYGNTPLPYYSNVDPSNASTSRSGSTNVYQFGVETTSSYAVRVWNAVGNATVVPFPTTPPDLSFTSSTIAFSWPYNGSPFPGIHATDWFVEATKTVTFDAGWYEFDLGTDDGSLLTLDGVTILDNYFLQALGPPRKKRMLVTAGEHTINIKYYEHDGYADFYFRFYPIDPPQSPLIEIGSPVSSPVNNRFAPSLGFHTDTDGVVTISGGCTSTNPVNVTAGTSTINLAILPNGTYGSCQLRLTDPDTDYFTEVAIPSFTVADPIPVHISDCNTLETLGGVQTGYADDYILDNDIDCTAYDVQPIYWDRGPYIGVFDGNGHTITNFNSDGDFYPEQALFSSISGGTVKNLTMGPGEIGGQYGAGAIALTASNLTLTNVTSTLVVTSRFGFEGTGGLVGELTFQDGTTTRWSNVVMNTQLSSGYRLGGLAGYLYISNSSTFIIDNAHVAATIDSGFGGLELVGGLFGATTLSDTSSLNITNSNADLVTDTLNGGGGGLLGSIGLTTDGPTSVTIAHSSTSGLLQGSSEIGGFIGQITVSDHASPYTLAITDSRSSMNVIGSSNNIGGFVGKISASVTGAVTSSIILQGNTATGDVSGFANVGGLLGGTDGSGGGMTINHAQGTGGIALYNNTASGAVSADTSSGGNVGGLVGYLSCKSNSSRQSAGCSIRQDMASGTVSGYHYVGGLIGQVDGDVNVEDVYATGNVTGSQDIGGLVGRVNSTFSFANVSRAYATGSVTTQGGAPVNVAGLIGSAYSNNQNTTIEHAFAIASLSDPSGAARFGWLIGRLEGIHPTDLAYSRVSGSAPACIQSDEAATYCVAQADPTYLYDSTHAPLTDWDFSDVWQEHGGGYPTLQMASVVTDRTAPVISVPSVELSDLTASISWQTDEPATANIVYSLDSSYGLSAGRTDISPLTRTHNLHIGTLPCSTYRFKVVSGDRSGNVSTSTGSQFTTPGCSGGSANRGSSGGGGGGSGSVSDWIIIQPVAARVSSPSAVVSTTVPLVTELVTTSASQPIVQTAARCYNFTFTTDLRLGMTAPAVKQLQQFLNRNGALIATTGSGSLGNETSYFGPSTKRALSRFQQTRQLVADGVFASTTRTLIQNLQPMVMCPVVTQAFTRNLALDMTGSDVSLLQRYLKVKQTGYFGPLTKLALQAFQKTRRLPTTGVVDAATQKLLNTLVKS